MVTTTDKWVAFGITVLAGFAAFLGAFSIFCIKQSQLTRVIPVALSFSAGIIIHLSFMHLVEVTRENFQYVLERQSDLSDAQINALSHLYTLLSVIVGIILMMIFERIAQQFGHNHEIENDLADNYDRQNNDSYGSTELTTTNHCKKNIDTLMDDKEASIKSKEQIHMKKLSYNIAIALILHHFPEGIATFVALVYQFDFGILVALALSLHDIPCGISMGTTIYCATGSYVQPFVACLIAAIAYPIGAGVGYIVIQLNTDSELLNGILFGLVSGVMIYIVLVQIIPSANAQIEKLNDKKIRLYSYISLFVGLLTMEISVILLVLTDFEG